VAIIFQNKTVGSAHTRKLFEKSLNKNFTIKIAKTARFLGNNINPKCACAFYKVFASLFSKSEWEFEGKALKALKIQTIPCIIYTEEGDTIVIIFPPDADILSPVDDHIFKTIMTHPDAKPSLMSVISACIDRSVVDVVVRNNELPITDNDEKNERLDVNCTIDGGDQVDVEMHGSHIEEVDDAHTNFFNKYVYYLTDLHSSQKSKGVKYYDFVRTYQITFCDYSIYPHHPEFITRASLRRPDGKEISSQINFILVELSKLKDITTKPIDKLSPLEMWSIFFRYSPDVKHRDLVNKVIAKRKEIAMAGELLLSISQDERERAHARSRRMYETDKISNELTIEYRKTLKIARVMKQSGEPTEKIAMYTGLSIAEVVKL